MVLVAEALLLKADNTAWFSTPWRHALEGLREAPPPGPVDQWRAIGSVFCSMLNTQLLPVNNFNSMTVTFVYNDINISVRFDRRAGGCRAALSTVRPSTATAIKGCRQNNTFNINNLFTYHTNVLNIYNSRKCRSTKVLLLAIFNEN